MEAFNQTERNFPALGMVDVVWDEVRTNVHLAFRTIIPPAEKRIPITLQNGIIPVLCYVPMILMAYLARRPDTYLFRVLLLPFTVSAVLVAAYHFTWTQVEFNVYNWTQCLMAAVTIAKAFEFALTKEGMLKIGETYPGSLEDKTKSVDNRRPTTNGYHKLDKPASTHLRLADYSPKWLSDAFELLHTNRGLSFKYGQHTYRPLSKRPLTPRHDFLVATLRDFVYNFLLVDFCESMMKLFPGGIATPLGGSIFYPSLSPIPRYIVSTTLHMLTGFSLVSGFEMVFDLVTLFAVGAIGDSPSAWPPVMEKPWLAESMHELWAKRWHQLLRQTFIVYGAYPGKWLFETLTSLFLAPLAQISASSNKRSKAISAKIGTLGMLLGTFVASGLFHELSMMAMNREFTWLPVVFFALQGPVLIGERMWRKFTGRKIGGRMGRLWVYFNMFIAAQPMVDSWHRRGLGGATVIPPQLSPMRGILIPALRSLVPTA
ncbi:hypothetical protein Agabi119p4_7305 [Agaricus bisporus var. burnettii]|uniref:Wax synthase domain-containing protein n=1 Tax=Agaricus bisporus var. burnettii TaxID=192524 RepID=A0A8H7C7D2_AGABI|nr:hypothetical protein Agabi119p4_7305 [Agaricus bisporus var. burnettii]